MKKMTVNLANCYGIKRLAYEFDFSKGSSYSIYAPNGSMKSSFAGLFMDIALGQPSKDKIFPLRVTTRDVKDESGAQIPAQAVVAVRPYSDEVQRLAKSSILLVNNTLRTEYEELYAKINAAKERLLAAVKTQAASKKDMERELATVFTKDNKIETALSRIRAEVLQIKEAPFKDVRYDKIFDDKVLEALGKGDVKKVIEDYIRKYDELLKASTYFRKGIFNYHQAGAIAKSLAENGFFNAKHTVHLNAAGSQEIITNEKQLEELIQKEKDTITNDKALKKQFADLDKLLYKNTSLREFNEYLSQDESVLPQLGNIELFREILLKNYLASHMGLFQEYLDTCEAAKERRAQIEELARAETTLWQNTIDIFNERFFVPFKLSVENRTQAILGEEILNLKFTFHEGADDADVEHTALVKILSTGEAKALYILDIIFEIEVRKQSAIETVFVVDDIADSFDYKNKYAIIEYLREIRDDPLFNLIVLTHNFDFFRTLESRGVVPYKHCLTAIKKPDSISLVPLIGFKNVFVNDWKEKFFIDPKKRIASVAFLRNILEYTRGENDPDYVLLTALLHLKPATAAITQADFDGVFHRLFGGVGAFPDQAQKVVPWIHAEAASCLTAAEGVNFENKVVLSIAIRLAAEEYMINAIADPAFVAAIALNQTTALLKRFESDFPLKTDAKKVLSRVILMTPENIHLNSFMYEPILDMSDDHLRRLYTDVRQLV